ncbi:MAG: A24 family peptidase [Gammaproteobacteria bacterium]
MPSLLETLNASPVLLYASAIFFGLAIGSFLNVVIHRLPLMMERDWREQCAELAGEGKPQSESETYNLWQPRSRCPTCGNGISARDNIPVLSYLLQHGRCRNCQARIALRYPVVEILGAIIAVMSVYKFGASPAALGAAGLGWGLIALAGIDLDHHLLPDSITMPLLWAGLIINLRGTYTPLQSAVIGAIAGYLILWTVYWAFKLVTGKEGMGYGDFKLLAALGAWTGWQQLPVIILLASAVGAILGITLILTKRQERSQPIPFGPFLATAGWLALLCGDSIISAYQIGTGLH